MPGNNNLHDSSRNKQDEFYTNLQLVENELKHYRAHFKGKRVLCNCDAPYESNFFKDFAMSFNSLGLRQLPLQNLRRRLDNHLHLYAACRRHKLI